MLAEELGIENVEDVLERRLGLEGQRQGKEYQIYCPNPRHEDHGLGSCSVNLKTGLWKCWACNAHGDLIRLVSMVQGIAQMEARRALQPNTREALEAMTGYKLSQALSTVRAQAQRRRSVSGGPYEPGPLIELRDRGFTAETLRRWGVRWVVSEDLERKDPKPDEKTTFTIRQCYAIPVEDENGHLLTWCYRRSNDSPEWQPRYIYSTHADISKLWFGLRHHANERHVYVVEGALDAMWLDQAGLPSLAMLGAGLSDEKVRKLLRYREVTVFADRDNGGMQALLTLGRVLGGNLRLRVARYPGWYAKDGKVDPQDVHPIDLEIAAERALPWQVFLRLVAA
jgi:DNA primase